MWSVGVPSMTEKIVVQFRGDDFGVESLTWGQWAHWGSQEMSGTTEPAGGWMAFNRGQTVEDIVLLLGYLMSRHQALRTLLRVGPDGTPQQVVHESGEIALDVIDADDTQDPAKVAEAVNTHYETSDWDLSREWPVRMAVIRHRGVATHFVAQYANIVVDGYGIDAIVADMPHMDPVTGAQLAPVPGVPPLAQAQLQREASAQRQNASSLRYWERHLRAIPARRLPGSTPHSPRYWQACYRSPAAHLALGTIAERTKV